MRVLGLDIGSSSVKAGIWDTQRRRPLSHVRAPYATSFNGARVEIDPEKLLRALRRAGRLAIAAAPGVIDAIAFCAFSSGVVVTDKSGKPRTSIITHADRRSVEIAAQLVKAAGKRWWLKHTGNLPYPGGIGASTLAWLRRHSPALFRGTYRTGQVSSLIGHTLCGQWITDPSQATFLGLWDIQSHDWSAQACQAVGISPAALPRVQWADEQFGRLNANLARLWKIAPGTPVIGGFVDTSAAVIQTPMTAGQLAHNAGSTDVLAICLDHPQPAEGILTRPAGVGRRYPQKWLAVRTIASSGSALQWARTTFFRELDDRAWNRTVQHACAQAHHAPASDGIECLPAFAGERAVIEQSAGAAFRGLHLGTTREAILLSLTQALARQSASNYLLLSKLHKPQRHVYAMGGASPLGDAMHARWPGRHLFRRLTGDSLAGLGDLAQKVLQTA